MTVVSSAVTVTVRVLAPTVRFRLAVFFVLASSSSVMATMAPLWLFVALSVIALMLLATAAV